MPDLRIFPILTRRAGIPSHYRHLAIMQSVFSLASRRKAGGESALGWIATVS